MTEVALSIMEIRDHLQMGGKVRSVARMNATVARCHWYVLLAGNP